MHMQYIFHSYCIHITYYTNIPCILLSYSIHIPYIFQASEPGTVFHVIPSAPPSPRANSLPLPHVAFACTSRVATCSDLGQDGRQRLILTFWDTRSMHIPFIFLAYSMHTLFVHIPFTFHAYSMHSNGYCKLARELNMSCKRCRMYSELFSFLWQLLLWGGRV